MTHEIHHELARRNRQLPNRDASAYQTVKMVVQRSSRVTAVVSLVFTNAAGQRLTDTQLAFAVISTIDSVGRQLSPLALLVRAQNALLIDAKNEDQPSPHV